MRCSSESFVRTPQLSAMGDNAVLQQLQKQAETLEALVGAVQRIETRTEVLEEQVDTAAGSAPPRHRGLSVVGGRVRRGSGIAMPTGSYLQHHMAADIDGGLQTVDTLRRSCVEDENDSGSSAILRLSQRGLSPRGDATVSKSLASMLSVPEEGSTLHSPGRKGSLLQSVRSSVLLARPTPLPGTGLGRMSKRMSTLTMSMKRRSVARMCPCTAAVRRLCHHDV